MVNEQSKIKVDNKKINILKSLCQYRICDLLNIDGKILSFEKLKH